MESRKQNQVNGVVPVAPVNTADAFMQAINGLLEQELGSAKIIVPQWMVLRDAGVIVGHGLSGNDYWPVVNQIKAAYEGVGWRVDVFRDTAATKNEGVMLTFIAPTSAISVVPVAPIEPQM